MQINYLNTIESRSFNNHEFFTVIEYTDGITLVSTRNIYIFTGHTTEDTNRYKSCTKTKTVDPCPDIDPSILVTPGFLSLHTGSSIVKYLIHYIKD